MIARKLAVAALLVAVSGVATFAQPPCALPPIDDGFGIGCCQIPNPMLPQPPAMPISAEWGVYDNCLLGFNAPGMVSLGAPVWVLCDYAIIPITIQLPMIMPINGMLLGKYVRTWMEADAVGMIRQVWRILVNGDLPFFGSTACPSPACLPPCAGPPWFTPVHMVGHIDYSCDPSTQAYSAAFSLTHMPGCIQHAWFSTASIPALANNPYSYHLVGPAPFSWGPMPEPQGPLFGDAERTSTLWWSPFFYNCEGEAPLVAGGSLTTVAANCLCSTAQAGWGPWRHQILNTASCCFGITMPIQSFPLPGTPLAPTGLVTLNVGHWNSSAAFPGVRTLSVYVGILTSGYTCNPVLQPFKAVTGVGTNLLMSTGWIFPAMTPASCPPPAFVPTRSFIDFQNMLPIVWAPANQPGLGSLFVSDWVLSLNTP